MRALCFFLALSVTAPAFAQTSETPAAPAIDAPLGLADVIASVERNFPLLTAAERETDIAEGELTAARGGFDSSWRTRAGTAPIGYYNPVLVDSFVTQPTPLWGTTFFAGWRLGVGASYTGIPVYDGKLETNDYGEVRAGVSVPLWRNGPIDRARANIRRAEQGRTIAALNVQQQRLEATRNATQRYWDWVAAGRRLAVGRSLLALATQRDEGLRVRVERGDLPAFERTDNARAIVQREGLVVALRRQVEQTAIELSLYVRDAQGRTRTPGADELPPGLPEPAALDPGCVRREAEAAPERRPEARRFDAQRAQQAVEREWAENQRRPAIDVTVAASQDLGPGPANRNGPVLEASLVLDIPILNRSATGREQAASAAMQRAEELGRFARDRIAADVRDALSAIEAARQRVTVARNELSLARTLAAQERERFNLGDSTLLVVNLREQAAAEAEVREIDALLEYHRAVAAWRFAIGAGRAEGATCEAARTSATAR
jgi:outer membrane protein TolC